MRHLRSLLILAALTASARVAASQIPDSALVTVHVFDAARAPVADAHLVVSTGDSTLLIVRTDSAGRRVLWLPVAAKPYQLAVLKLGYVSTRRLLRVAQGDSTSADVTLVGVPADTVAVSLPTVKVQASRRRTAADTIPELEKSGFYDRRYEGFAPQNAFLTAEQISHWNVYELKDLGRISGRDVLHCTIYLNGAKVGAGGLNANLPADQLAGVEIYRGIEAPIQYATGGCVALLWLK